MNKKILILYTNYGTGHYQAAKAINEDSEDEKILEAINYSAMLCNYRILNYCLNIYNKKHHGKYDYLNDFKILEFKNYKV